MSSTRYPLRVRAAVQLTRVFLMLAVIVVTGMTAAIAAAVLAGSSAGFGFGAVAGFLLCLSPEVWQLVVLRIEETRSGDIRIQDLRLSMRTAAEFVPRWHPDSAAADRA